MEGEMLIETGSFVWYSIHILMGVSLAVLVMVFFYFVVSGNWDWLSGDD